MNFDKIEAICGEVFGRKEMMGEQFENVGEKFSSDGLFDGVEDVEKRARRCFEFDSEQDDIFEGKNDKGFEDEMRIECFEDQGKILGDNVIECFEDKKRIEGLEDQTRNLDGNFDEGFENKKRIEGFGDKRSNLVGKFDEGLCNEKILSMIDGGNGIIMPKKKRGRPKGVKNKPKLGKSDGDLSVNSCALMVIDSAGVVRNLKKRKKDVSSSVDEVKERLEEKVGEQDLLKGSKKKNKKIMVAKVQEGILEKEIKRCGRPKGTKNKKKGVILVAEVGKKTEKHGRPRGSMFDKNVNVGDEGSVYCKQRQSKGPKKKICEREKVCDLGEMDGVKKQVGEAGSEAVQGVRNDLCEVNDMKEMVAEAISDTSLRGTNDVKASFNHRKKKRGRPRGKRNKRIILVDGIIHRVISSQNGGRNLVVQKDMGVLGFPRHFDNEKADDGEVLDESSNGKWKPRRKGSNYQFRARNKLEFANGLKREQSSMCHQCLKCEKIDVIACSYCKKKRYCFPCLLKWYPERTKKEVHEACPFCLGNCNCKACLQEKLVMKDRQKDIDGKVKFERLLYLMCKINPVLKHMQDKQSAELEAEARTRGETIQEEDILKTRVDIDERIYCDNCSTSIVNFHRSCPSSVCSFDLCLSCCQELRAGWSSDVHEAESSFQSIGGSSDHGTRANNQNHAAGKLGNREMFSARNHQSSTVYWKTNLDGSILCPPKTYGGCGLHILELRRILEPNWVETLMQEIDKATADYHVPETDFSQDCPICHSTLVVQRSAAGTRKAASRQKTYDNHLTVQVQ